MDYIMLLVVIPGVISVFIYIILELFKLVKNPQPAELFEQQSVDFYPSTEEEGDGVSEQTYLESAEPETPVETVSEWPESSAEAEKVESAESGEVETESPGYDAVCDDSKSLYDRITEDVPESESIESEVESESAEESEVETAEPVIETATYSESDIPEDKTPDTDAGQETEETPADIVEDDTDEMDRVHLHDVSDEEEKTGDRSELNQTVYEQSAEDSPEQPMEYAEPEISESDDSERPAVREKVIETTFCDTTAETPEVEPHASQQGTVKTEEPPETITAEPLDEADKYSSSEIHDAESDDETPQEPEPEKKSGTDTQ